MSNKLTTQGYFIKRLRDCGYKVDKLYENYSETDPRSWTIIIDPGGASILCTCYINVSEVGDNYFELYDGGQTIPGKLSIKTSSIEVVIEYMNKFNIPKIHNNKPSPNINK